MKKVRRIYRKGSHRKGSLFAPKGCESLTLLRLEMNFNEEIAPDKTIESHRPRLRKRANRTLSMAGALKLLEKLAAEYRKQVPHL